MIEKMEDLPGNAIGLTASGKVTADDYEKVVIPAIENRIEEFGTVRVLYHLGPAFEGFTAGAMWDDMKIGFGHLASWEKAAIVTDHDWIAGATRLFALALPCPVKVFADGQLDEAKRWIEE